MELSFEIAIKAYGTDPITYLPLCSTNIHARENCCYSEIDTQPQWRSAMITLLLYPLRRIGSLGKSLAAREYLFTPVDLSPPTGRPPVLLSYERWEIGREKVDIGRKSEDRKRGKECMTGRMSWWEGMSGTRTYIERPRGSSALLSHNALKYVNFYDYLRSPEDPIPSQPIILANAKRNINSNPPPNPLHLPSPTHSSITILFQHTSSSMAWIFWAPRREFM